MKIGVDISQCAFGETGVSNYLKQLIFAMLGEDQKNEYVFFYSSLRRPIPDDIVKNIKELGGRRAEIKTYKFPPSFLSTLWNTIHKLPIETFVGDVDIFISSDWYQPPSKKAKLGTIIYDMIVYKYPKETHARTSFSLKNLRLKQNIVTVQKKRLRWVKKECSFILCISESTKKDVEEILGIDEKKLFVVYPGV
jgi:glycosyltransferase involved in cell wall biosynthesis